MRRVAENARTRLGYEDGATAVFVGIILVMLLGFAAIVIDVGNGMWERRMLQNSADAAAIAAAQDYAAGEGASAEATASEFASENNPRGAHVEEFLPDEEAGEVTVVARTGDAANPGELQSWIASVIGRDDYFARARAVAAWGQMGGAPTIPITFSWCEWDELVGDPDSLPSESKTIYFLNTGPPGGGGPGGASECYKEPPGHYTPAGWGWLDPTDEANCIAEIDETGEVDGSQSQGLPSAQVGSGCTPEFFEALIGQVVLIPIWGQVTGEGDNTVYTIEGFAAMEFEAYRLHTGGGTGYSYGTPPPCGASETCIRGKFVDYVALGDHIDYGAGDFGATVVVLKE